ncbi:MAG TPA: DNA polymerase IV [Tissierellales bacterium]|nr:DNA polymerase IV [Tissierellales bacterium]
MTKRSIIHVDMDAFYASVEEADNPLLKGKPIIVGGRSGSRGVVSASSYEARKYGVHSAMSMAKAKQLCPKGVFLPVNMKRYKEVSKEANEILKEHSLIIEPISIDEAFLDVTGKNPYIISKSIKKRIKNELGLTVSIGISFNKFLAKLASDVEKPNGLTIVKKNEAVNFLVPLPIRKLWGVGPKTERELNKLGIYTIGDMQRYDMNVLIRKFGKRGKELSDFSKGIDNRVVENDIKTKSIGEEETYIDDVDDIGFLVNKLDEYSLSLAHKLDHHSTLAKTITVKVKYEDFSVETRSLTLSIPTNKYPTIFEISKSILINKFSLEKKVRLLGLSLSNLIHPNDPLQLNIEM